MTRRNLTYGLLGWAAPGVVALPFAAMREAAGGESALLAIIVWWGLGAIGCFIAGLKVGTNGRASGTVSDAFVAGLAGVATSWVASVVVSAAIEAVVKVLHLGAVSLLIPIPFVVGYAIGFGLRRWIR